MQCPSSKADRPSVTILTVSLCLSLVHCAIPAFSSQNTIISSSLLATADITSQHCQGRINLPDKNKSETAAVLPPAGKLTSLRWTEILFFVYVTLARPSAGIPWENQHLSPFYRKNFKQSCWLVFPNVAFFATY